MVMQLKQVKGRNVMFLDRNGKWKSTGCKTKQEAKAWFVSNFGSEFPYFEDFAKGFFTDRGPDSFHDMCMKTKRYQNYEWWESNDARLKNYVLPMFGSLMWNRITTPLIQDWYLSLKGISGRPIADATKKKILNCLNVIMKHAKFRGIIKTNPCEGVMRIVEENRERKPFSEEELVRMFPIDTKRLVSIWTTLQMACFMSIAKDTGWRPGEIAGLTFENYFPEYCGIYTTQSIDFVKHVVKPRVKTTGNGYKYRTGIISDQTKYVMEEYIRTIPEKERTGLIFKGKDGKPITLRWIEKSFKTGLERLGLSTEQRPLYSLRTTFFTIGASTMPDDVLMELMGHKKWHVCYDKRTPEAVIKKMYNLLRA